jgi:N-acetylmuramoyl-L-alanine amidase
MVTLARGDRGDPVADVQARLVALGYPIDPREHAEFGPSTQQAVRGFQQRRRLNVDGIVGDLTWSELVEAGYSLGDRILYLRFPYFRGDDVRELQTALNLLGFDAGREDGILGERTDRAVRDFQRNVGLPQDGIVGSTTLDGLRRLRPVGVGPGRAAVREREALRRLQASLRHARIAVDAAQGPDDPGGAGPTGLTVAQGSYLLAHAFAEELRRRGANPFLLRTPDTDPSPAERARVANEIGPEVLVALGIAHHDDAAAEGAATYYYGREAWHSQAGQQLAELIQQEITSRLGLKDGRTHPRTLPLLRETTMPAVYVEPCFVSNPREESLVRTEAFRRQLAESLADAVERFFRQGSTESALQDQAIRQSGT